MCARSAVEQYEFGFAGIQHNRYDYETYAVVLPYDLNIVFLCGRSRWALLCRITLKTYKQDFEFVTFRMPSLGPCWTTQGNVKNWKTSAMLHRSAPAKNKTSATLHGNVFVASRWSTWSPTRSPQNAPDHLLLLPDAFGAPFKNNKNRTSRNRCRKKITPHCMRAQFLTNRHRQRSPNKKKTYHDHKNTLLNAVKDGPAPNSHRPLRAPRYMGMRFRQKPSNKQCFCIGAEQMPEAAGGSRRPN